MKTRTVIFGCLVMLLLTGFSSCKHVPVVVDPCAKCPKIWTGKAGTNPTENNEVWKCYDWILKSQELER
jgi:hypothetical protein